MNFRSYLLNERFDTNLNNLIIVDIQPSYSRYIHFLDDFRVFLTKTLNAGKKVIFFYNGEDVGSEDNPHSIIEWLYEYDYEDYNDLNNLSKRIIWVEKGFGFFRSWMDFGIDERTIIKTIRYMAQKKVNDSRNLSDEDLSGLTYGDGKPVADPIYLPNISLSTLKQFSGAYMCGGGRNECLKEVQILMNAFNIKYTLLNRFIYG